jgi:hypothetical protein
MPQQPPALPREIAGVRLPDSPLALKAKDPCFLQQIAKCELAAARQGMGR